MADVTAARIRIPVETDAGRATLSLGELDKALGKMRGSTDKATSSTLSLIKGFAGYDIIKAMGRAIIGAGAAAVRSSMDFEQNTTALTTMLGSGEKARKMMADLATFAAQTPLELKDLQQNAKLLLNFGIAGEDVISTLQMLGDVAGGNAERLNRLSLAFGQMSSTGRLMGQDLLQMVNAGFNPLQAISEKTGKSVSQLKKEMEQGGITAQMVKDAFKDVTSEGGKFYQMMQAQSVTLGGQLSTLRDNLDMLGREFADKFSPALTELTNAFNDSLQQGGFFRDVILQIGEAIAVAARYLANFTRQLDVMNIGGKVTENLEKQRKLIDDMTRMRAKGLDGENMLYKSRERQLDVLQSEYNRLTELREKRLSDIDAYTRGELTSFQKLQEKYKNYNNNKVALNKAANDQMAIDDDARAKKQVDLIMRMLGANATYYQQLEAQFFSHITKRAEMEGEDSAARLEFMRAQYDAITAMATMDAETREALIRGVSDAIRKEEMKQTKTYAQFGLLMVTTTAGMLADIQTIFRNVGNESYALAVGMKALAMAEAAINSYLAYTMALRDPTIPSTIARHIMAGVILAAGLAKQIAIATTPIPKQGAQFGGSFVVPPGNEADSGLLRVNQGEQVDITPVRDTGGENKTFVLRIGNKDFEAYVIETAEMGFNTGRAQIRKPGAVKIA